MKMSDQKRHSFVTRTANVFDTSRFSTLKHSFIFISIELKRKEVIVFDNNRWSSATSTFYYFITSYHDKMWTFLDFIFDEDQLEKREDGEFSSSSFFILFSSSSSSLTLTLTWQEKKTRERKKERRRTEIERLSLLSLSIRSIRLYLE